MEDPAIVVVEAVAEEEMPLLEESSVNNAAVLTEAAVVAVSAKRIITEAVGAAWAVDYDVAEVVIRLIKEITTAQTSTPPNETAQKETKEPIESLLVIVNNEAMEIRFPV